jgi:hypothetical protein
MNDGTNNRSPIKKLACEPNTNEASQNKNYPEGMASHNCEHL